MKLKMKVIAAALLTSLAVQTAYVPKADAGALLVLAGAAREDGYAFFGSAAPAFIVLGLGLGGLGAAGIAHGNVALGVIGILLDGDGKISQTGLETSLMEKYSILKDNPDATRDLTRTIRAKLAAGQADSATKNQVFVQLSNDEIDHIFEPIGLSATSPELKNFVNDWK